MKAVFVATLAAIASVNAFAPQRAAVPTSLLKSSETAPESTEIWDPLSLYELGLGESFDTFPNMFPHPQFLEESEIKQGRMSMLAWTGIWATHKVGAAVGMTITVLHCEYLCVCVCIWPFVSCVVPCLSPPTPSMSCAPS